MSQTNNENVISNGFSRLRTDGNRAIREAMINALRRGVIIALEIHDERHQEHIETGGSYGWALWENGVYVDGEVKTKGSANQGNAEAAIKAKNPRKNGFYGVVVAGMGGSYYALDYERYILSLTADEIKQEFPKYFKRI